MRTTITISRQLGSGGSYLGQVIARRLGLKYIDREVLRLAAKEFDCDEETVAARENRVTGFWNTILNSLTFGSPEGPYTPPPLRNFSDQELFAKQTEILKRIAAENDCVVTGWAGVFLLPRHSQMFSIFCHAPIRFRCERVRELGYAADAESARRVIKESDALRKRYFAAMTGHEWDCAENYHLSIDTSLLPLDDIAELLLQILQMKGIAR